MAPSLRLITYISIVIMISTNRNSMLFDDEQVQGIYHNQKKI